MQASTIKNFIISLLKDIEQKVSLACDVWSSITANNYLGVSCHFFNKEWKLTKKILALSYLNEPKKADYLFETIRSVTINYDIKEKVFGCVSDSGRDIKAAINQYPNLVFRLPCANHRLNLCFNDLFKIIDIKFEKNDSNQMYIMAFNDEGDLVKTSIDYNKKKAIDIKNIHKTKINFLIEKCRHLVGSFKHSSHLKRKLKEKQDQLKYESKIKLIQDINIRWNSTYDLLDSISCNMRALQALKLENDCLVIHSYVPSEKEFEMIDEICNLLLPLKELTNLFAGQTYCTISVLMPAVYNLIYKELPEMKFELIEINSFKEMLIDSLKARFNYLEDDLIKVCTLLDFQFKNFEFLKDDKLAEEYKKKAKQALLIRADEFISTKEQSQIILEETKQTKSILKDTSNIRANTQTFTQNKGDLPTQLVSSQPSKVINKKREVKKNISNQLKDKIIISKGNFEKSKLEVEIDNYLNHSLIIDDPIKKEIEVFGSIYFFKENYKSYPLLTTIAKSFLSLPATSNPCEALFSQSGITQTDLRNRLYPETLENLILIKENRFD